MLMIIMLLTVCYHDYKRSHDLHIYTTMIRDLLLSHKWDLDDNEAEDSNV